MKYICTCVCVCKCIFTICYFIFFISNCYYTYFIIFSTAVIKSVTSWKTPVAVSNCRRRSNSSSSKLEQNEFLLLIKVKAKCDKKYYVFQLADAFTVAIISKSFSCILTCRGQKFSKSSALCFRPNCGVRLQYSSTFLPSSAAINRHWSPAAHSVEQKRRDYEDASS